MMIFNLDNKDHKDFLAFINKTNDLGPNGIKQIWSEGKEVCIDITNYELYVIVKTEENRLRKLGKMYQ